MKNISLAFVAVILGLGLTARAQENSPAEPAAASPAPKAEAPAAKPEVPKEAPKKEEAAGPAEAEKPAAKPAAKAKAAAVSPAALIDAEWRFLKDSAEENNSDVADAAVDDLKAFVQQHPDGPMRPEALVLLASSRQKKGDTKGAMVDFLRLIYEYPDSAMTLQAKSSFLELAGKKLKGRLMPAANDLIKNLDSESAAERLATLVGKLAESMEDSLYEPTVEEVRRFQLRFPDYPQSDKIQWSLAQLHEKSSKYGAALLSYRKLLAVYPQSAFRAKAQLAIGDVYAENLRDYKKAIDSYQELVEKNPEAPEVLPALERTAQLFSDRLKQYELAVQIDEKIVKRFSGTEAALKALNAEAKLQRDRLGQSAEAIKTYLRLAQQFRYPPALEALRNAAAIARKDLKDYQQEADLRRRMAKSFPLTKEAAAELYSAAEICEDDLKDLDKAIETYKEVAEKFPGTREAQKASERAAKLEAKKQP